LHDGQFFKKILTMKLNTSDWKISHVGALMYIRLGIIFKHILHILSCITYMLYITYIVYKTNVKLREKLEKKK